MDPFAGVGTTAVAAKRLGRQFIGFELSPKYCKAAIQRLEEEEARKHALSDSPAI